MKSPVTPALKRITLSDWAKELRLEESALETFNDFYFNSMDQYGNEIYAQVETRVAHWTSFLEHNWFAHRLDLFLDRCPEFDVVVDLGFSVPYPYSRLFDPRYVRPHYLFVDKDESVLLAYDALLKMSGLESRKQHDSVVIADIEDREDHEQIADSVRSWAPRRLLIGSSEVIEHLENPNNIWELIGNLISLPTVESGLIYVTLPIGKKIPSHRLEFLSENAALAYVDRYLRVESSEFLLPKAEDSATPYLTGCSCVFGALRA